MFLVLGRYFMHAFDCFCVCHNLQGVFPRWVLYGFVMLSINSRMRKIQDNDKQMWQVGSQKSHQLRKKPQKKEEKEEHRSSLLGMGWDLTQEPPLNVDPKQVHSLKPELRLKWLTKALQRCWEPKSTHRLAWLGQKVLRLSPRSRGQSGEDHSFRHSHQCASSKLTGF